ncbi:MAG: ABC transporter substrate-binding protein [Oscillospiraceae bacterium]|nr:ABC transporter substrate-binding protein [Oscillospiraceae bacterium]
MKSPFRSTLLFILLLCLVLSLLSGCGKSSPAEQPLPTESAAEPESPAPVKKTLVIGDTTFNAENWEETIDPHRTYNGWPCIRYGVGETLVQYTDTMELEPWLALSWENDGNLTWTITLRDDVSFSSGRKMDGEAVRQCLQHLLENHDRAPGDTRITDIKAEGQVLTITTSEPNPALMNYLGDPYGCIIDVDASDFETGVVVGTGPYAAVDMVTDEHLTLVKNDQYWNGTPKIDEITIRTLSNGDTLSAALQAGDIDAAYGMAYEAYPNFENENYQFSSIQTSRAFFCSMNMTSTVIQDPAVRKAIAMGINKEGFVSTLLDGHGVVGNGAFPNGFSTFGGEKIQTEGYDPEAAKAVLEAAGWTDDDGDGIREKDGTRLTVRWLTYPSRQELPLLAEAAQASLKEIGIEVDINNTANRREFLADMTSWDIYASALVTAPSGDPQYFFTTSCLPGMSYNFGAYENEHVSSLIEELSTEFDTERRAQLAVELQQTILDDNAYVFCSFLQMNMISRANVSNWNAHACDYYEVTADLDIS